MRAMRPDLQVFIRFTSSRGHTSQVSQKTVSEQLLMTDEIQDHNSSNSTLTFSVKLELPQDEMRDEIQDVNLSNSTFGDKYELHQADLNPNKCKKSSSQNFGRRMRSTFKIKIVRDLTPALSVIEHI